MDEMDCMDGMGIGTQIQRYVMLTRGMKWFFPVWTAVAGVAVAAETAAPVSDGVELLPAVEVRETRLALPVDDVTATPSAVQDALAATPGVQVVAQGVPTAQSDLKIRGSSFSGAGLAVAGLALRNPQTEHFNTELPLPPQLFGAPRALTGLEQMRETDGHLVGTADFEFLPVERRGAVEAGVGEIGRNWQTLFLQEPLSREPDPVWGSAGLSAFGGRESAGMTDGLSDNFLERQAGGLHLQQRQGGWQTDVVAAEQHKEFGARGFYGAPASMPSREELTDRLVLGSSRMELDDGGYVRATASWRELLDTYDLDRDRTWLYENRHRSDVFSLNVDGGQRLADPLFLRWRAEAESERLTSRYEGTLPGAGLGDQRRDRLGLSLLPEWTAGPVKVTLGGKAQAFSDDRPAWLPAAGVEVAAAKDQTVYLTYTENVRQPSFTELNYDSPGSLGNQGLERQHDQTLELGWRGKAGQEWDWKTAVFAERSENAVDWIKTGAASKWLATNLGRVETLGVEAGGGWHPGRDWDFTADLLVLDKSADEDVYASRYVLDYAEESLTLGVRHRLTSWCSLSFRQGVAFQADNPVRTGPEVALPASAECRLALPRLPGAELVLGVENLWNSGFEPFPGQPAAGQRFSAALAWTW